MNQLCQSQTVMPDTYPKCWSEVSTIRVELGRAFRHEIVPHGGFTDPEYGSVGLTEEQANPAHDCVGSVVPYADWTAA